MITSPTPGFSYTDTVQTGWIRKGGGGWGILGRVVTQTKEAQTLQSESNTTINTPLALKPKFRTFRGRLTP